MIFEQLAKDLAPTKVPPDCRSCDGKGRVWYPGCGDTDTACSACNGTGYEEQTNDRS